MREEKRVKAEGKEYGQKKSKEMKEDTEKIRKLGKKRKELRKTEMIPKEKYVENLMKKENEAE